MASGGGGGGNGPSSRIGDSVDAVGTTTPSNAILFDIAQPNRIIGIGTIVNTGDVNDMVVVETLVDKFGTTITVERVLTAGEPYMLDLQTNFGDDISKAYPPYVEYKVQVRDGFSGSHTTYELHYIDLNPTP